MRGLFRNNGEYPVGAGSVAGVPAVGGGGGWFGSRVGGLGSGFGQGGAYGYSAPGGAGYAGGAAPCAEDADGACGPAACGPGCAGCASCGGCGTSCGGGATRYIYGIVGERQGDFNMVPTYQYVGAGAGNVALVPIPGPGCSSCWWLLCFGWLFIIPFLLPATTTTSTTTTSVATPPPDVPPPLKPTPPPTPAPEQGACRIYGDPHVVTFDGGHASFYSSGEYWLVKSETVWVQARYMPTPVTNGLAVMKEIAVGGPFLDSEDGSKNILRITATTATWNGGMIIPGFPDEFTNKDPKVKVVTDGNGEIFQPNRAGKQMHVVHVSLPLDVEVQINRWNEPTEGDYINAQITMSPQPGQDGHCGNFNGDSGDDSRPAIRARVGTTGVDPQDLLFNTKTPVRAPNRPDLNDCATEKADRARQLCAAKSKVGMADKDCMIDVCFGGERFAQMSDYD